jgi:hypothetical protein
MVAVGRGGEGPNRCAVLHNSTALSLCDAAAASHILQVREKFHAFSGQELACIAWALRRFGYAPEHNAVFYMLERQVGAARSAVHFSTHDTLPTVRRVAQ